MNQSQPEPKAALHLPASSHDDLWQMALNDLRYQMTKATFNNWLGGSSILKSTSSPSFWLSSFAMYMPGNGLPTASIRLSHAPSPALRRGT